MTRTLMTIGECMVEMAPGDDGRFAMGFAGDMFNSAWYARQIAGNGLRVAFLSATGDDAVSGEMEHFIRAAGVEPLLSVVPGKSVGLYLISLKDGERSFSYWRSDSAARRLTDGLDRLPGLVSGDWVLVSGITLAILDDDRRARLLGLLHEAKSRGVLVALDPNIRPRLWTDAGEMRRQIMRTAALSDLVLPSFDDEAAHFGDATPEATLARYRAAGAASVVVKNGAGPVMASEGEAPAVTVHPPTIPAVVDTTAAGDAFNGGFLSARLAGASLTDSIQAGCDVAAQVIRARGALVPVKTART
ncbi:sugar kinase [Nioella ostreopsis]|uniref:sugar kinase n=1 Tax=Nioella ostreopsis TaxID=2448479 RepID=UPI000FD856C2|nr:sugar kinase [Nioella ostreopsis]